MKLTVFALAALFAWTGAAEAQTGSPCGASAPVKAGDTLSSIAERCNVSESALLRANPTVQGSDDLRVGMDLRIPDPTSLGAALGTVAGHLRDYAVQAGDTLDSIAGKVGSSVDDLLKANPDLHQRLLKLGDRLNIPGVNANTPQASIVPQSGPVGTAVTVSALGLPADAPMVIGGGAPHSAYQVLDRVRTSRDGTLQATVQIPASAADKGRFVVVVATPEGQVEARTAPFQIAEKM